MNSLAKETKSLSKLLRIARGEADHLREDLADIVAARAAAAAALSEIDQTMESESALGSGIEFAEFVDASRERRRILSQNLATLEDAEDVSRERLRQAFLEIEKLNALLDARAVAARRLSNKRESGLHDEIAAGIARR